MKVGGGKVVVYGFNSNLGGLFMGWLLRGEGGRSKSPFPPLFLEIVRFTLIMLETSDLVRKYIHVSILRKHTF